MLWAASPGETLWELAGPCLQQLTRLPARLPPCLPQAGSGMRFADLMDAIAEQSSVRVSERDVRLALGELEETVRFQNGIVSLR